MSFTEDVLITIKGNDQASQVFDKVRNSSSKMKVVAGAAMTAVGAATLSYAKDAVNSAVTAEAEWARFGSAVSQTGGNWDTQSTEIKKWISNYSNSMGYAVVDTRSAMTAMMNYGLSCNEAEKSMSAVTGMAAKLGVSQEQAAGLLTKAFAGQGRGLKQLGLNIADYKDEATGAIDKNKLLQDVLNKTGNAAEKHANTQEAQITRVNNALKSIKTDFGYALMSAIEPLLPLVQQFLQTINSLPAPVKTVGFAFVGLTAGVAAVSGPLLSLHGVLQTMGVSFSDIAEKIGLAKNKLSEFGNESQVLGGGVGNVEGNPAYQKYKTTVPETDIPVKSPKNPGKYDDVLGGLDKEKEGLDKVDKKTREVGDKAKKTSETVKNTNNKAKGMDGLGKTTKMVPKGLGAEAAAGGAEASAASGGMASLSAGITSMLVPILTLAAVVAVVIAVVAVLVVEALLFARAIAEVVKALGFDKIDLSKSIEGIKSIGTAMWELAKALTGMTIASAVSIVSQGIMLLTGGLKSIANSAKSLRNTVPIVNSLANIGDINPDATSKIKALGEGLKGLSDATSGLTGAGTNVWIGGFTNWITGGSLNNLRNAHDTLVNAVPVINSFSDLPAVNTEASKRLKDVGEALKNVKTAIDSLQGVDGNWGIIGNVINNLKGITNLSMAHATLKNVANQINKFSDLPAITPVGGKLVPLANALKAIKSAVNSLTEFNGLTIPPASVATKVQTAKMRLRGVAVQLNDVQSLPNVPNISGKLSNITKNINSVKTSVKSLQTINTLTIPPASVATKVQTAKMRLRGVAVQLNDMKSLPTVVNIAPKLNKITSAMKPLKTSINSIKAVPQVQSNVATRVKKAVSAVKSIAKELNQLKGTNVTSTGNILKSISSALKQINTTLNNAKVSVRASSVGIGQAITHGVKAGLTGLRGAVTNPTSQAMSAMMPIAANGGRSAGTNATNGFKFTFKIADVAKQEMNNAVQAVKNGSGALASACREVAQNAVAEAKNGAGVHSPGHIARMWGEEIGVYSVMKIMDGKSALIRAVNNVSQAVVKSWGNPELGINTNTGNLTGLAKSVQGLNLTKTSRLNTVHDLSNNRPNEMLSKNNITQIHIHDGAVQLDARNLTDKQCKQIMITGLESLDCVKNIDIKGVK